MYSLPIKEYPLVDYDFKGDNLALADAKDYVDMEVITIEKILVTLHGYNINFNNTDITGVKACCNESDRHALLKLLGAQLIKAYDPVFDADVGGASSGFPDVFSNDKKTICVECGHVDEQYTGCDRILNHLRYYGTLIHIPYTFFEDGYLYVYKHGSRWDDYIEFIKTTIANDIKRATAHWKLRVELNNKEPQPTIAKNATPPPPKTMPPMPIPIICPPPKPKPEPIDPPEPRIFYDNNGLPILFDECGFPILD